MSNVNVSLCEWEALRPEHGSILAGRNLENDANRELAEHLADAKCVEILELARGLEIRATSFVGRLSLGELTITIQPKLSGAPFLNLLRYAYGLRHLSVYQRLDYDSEKWTFQDLLIQQLAAEVAELLARGIHRDYERLQAQLAVPRGRIAFDRLAGDPHRSSAVLPCVHYPRTEDTLLNQVTLAGLVHAARLTTNVDLRAHLSRLVKSLTETVSLRKLNQILLSDAKLILDRRTRAYRSTLVLIELLLGNEGVSLEGETERVRLPGFLFDMNRFFQALLSRFLHDHLEGVEVQDEHRLNELFYYDSDRNPRKRRAPVQKPDFVIRRSQQVEAILDAKYRDLWEKPLPREMLYQLALYALGQSTGERSATILYPTLASEATEQAILLREPSTGAPQAQVILRPVNLLKLEMLLRDEGWKSNTKRMALAHQLSFGTDLEMCGNAGAS
jgi:5-methylcytosine-specific restriction enzyme subunit McrC